MQKIESKGAIIWRFIYPTLLFVGVGVVIEIVLTIIYSARYLSSSQLTNADDVIKYAETVTKAVTDKALYITLARCIIVCPLFMLFMKRDVERDKVYGRYVEYEPYNKIWLILLPFAGFAAAMGFNHVVPILIEGLQSLFSKMSGQDVDLFATYNKLSGVVYSGGLVVQIIASAILAPLAEELLFRGLIYKRIRTYTTMLPAMLISALVFGIIHGNIVQFLYAFIIGLFLAFVYERFKTIIAPFIFHAGANLIAVIVTYFFPEEIGLETGTFMLLVVGELAVAFVLLKIIDLKVNRRTIDMSDSQ